MSTADPRSLDRKLLAQGLAFVLLLAPMALSPACGEEKDKNDETPQPSGLVCDDPAILVCADQTFQDLDMKTGVAPGLITNELQAATWTSVVDATAGGAFTITDAYVYARFTEAGLEKLQLDDDQGLASMDWDVALRRFVIRLNGGDSGPSCVAGVRMPDGTDFDSVTAAPQGAPWRLDDYYTDACDFIPDSYGLGSPETVLSGFWTYPGCVQMTGNVYVLRLRDNRAVKLTVDAYYYPEVQAECQDNDATSTMPTGSANIRLRWAFL